MPKAKVRITKNQVRLSGRGLHYKNLGQYNDFWKNAALIMK